MADINIFPIVGIGASAGGLEPLESFFDNVSPESGFAFVVIQHLAPNHKSMMDELLARHTMLPIQVIEDGMVIKPNNIYLNPPKKFVEIQAGHFSLSEKEDRKLSFPISTFFESLSLDRAELAAAVILSGTGSDGSEGVRYVKERGGLVLAQNPESAKFDGMPKSAIHTGSVDKVSEVYELPRELNTFFSNSITISEELSKSDQQKELVEDILSLVEKHTGVNFFDYKMSTIQRRILRRTGILGFSNLDEYYREIRSNPPESHKLASEMLIGVTRFFRDEDAFETLRNEVIPKLFEQNEDTKTIRIWVPACSTGEEAYSLAILCSDYQRRNNLRYEITVFATDLDKEAIKLASNRIFPESISNEVPQHLMMYYFIPQKNGYRVSKEIREKIVFSVHNIIQDPPFSKIDLLSCRNFLIYLNSTIQQRLFVLFQYALKQNGFLFLGSSESLGQMSDQFAEVSNKYKIFRNKYDRKLVQLRRGKRRARSLLRDEQENGESIASGTSGVNTMMCNAPRKMLSEVQELIIQEFSPDTIVFSDSFELIHTTGRVNQWLRLPQGEITTNVVRMLPENVGLAFELMASKALKTGETVSLTNVKVEGRMREVYDGRDVIQIQIKRLPLYNGSQFIAATFLPVSHLNKVSDSNRLDLSMASKEKIGILERELSANKENLQSIIEELESSNEELQAANEELQSSNEELESVNEELYTVNAEYQEKVAELSDSNNDLDNLIQSTDIAILFLDSQLNIRKFTPSIRPILNLLPQDVGRHISHFRSKLQVEDFMIQVERVHEELEPHEAITKDLNGRDYIMRITPFRTMEREIRGVIIAFIDISASVLASHKLVLSEKALEKANTRNDRQTELFELIANNSSDLITLNSLDGTIEYISPSCLELTGYEAGELRQMDMGVLVPHKRHKKLWIDAADQLSKGKSAGLLRFLLRMKDGKERWFESSVSHITEQSGAETRLLITTRDIHNRVEMEKKLNQLSVVVDQTQNAILLTDSRGRVTYANNAMEKISGYSESELLGKKPGDLLQGEETDPKSVRKMSKAIKSEKKFNVDVINYHKDGTKYWVNIHCEPIYDLDEHLSGFVSIQHEVSVQKEYELQINRLNNLLRDQNHRLMELNKSLEDFAYIASHDLKTPLRNIRTMMDLIIKNREKATPERMNQYFDVMRNAVIEMNTMIENLLQYSRSGRITEEKEVVETKVVFDEIKNLFKSDIKETSGKLKFNTKVGQVVVFPILFKRLLTNLLSNAIKYRSEKLPEIHVSLTEKSGRKLLKVEDNGLGIEENQHENIFRIFSSSGLNKDSNGIGLAVCRNIAQHHNGRIWVESKPGEGSTFFVEFEG